ncbi:MAG: hypothetical protein QXF02_06675 [Candidatus Korarchaeota archaeon]
MNKYGGIDRSILEDYLALKYLRNVIVHTKWRLHEKEWVEKIGFPSDVRILNEEHWYRILEVSKHDVYRTYRYSRLNGGKIPEGKAIKVLCM